MNLRNMGKIKILIGKMVTQPVSGFNSRMTYFVTQCSDAVITEIKMGKLTVQPLSGNFFLVTQCEDTGTIKFQLGE